MKKEVDYSREQAEQVRADYMSWVPHVIGGNTSLEAFINTKFPPKIDYIGRVWKDLNGWIGLVTKQTEEGYLYGYGFNQDSIWIKRLNGYLSFFGSFQLPTLTQATQEEWEEALDKERIERGLVEGINIKSMVLDGKKSLISENNNYSSRGLELSSNLNTLQIHGITIMQDGKWAEPELRPSPSVHSVREAISFIELHKKQFFAPTEIEVNGVKYKKQQ